MRLTEVVGQLKLDDRLKMKYTELAQMFESDIQKNITRSHFDLEQRTGIPYDEWASFLSVTEVAGWLNETMRQLARAGERRLINEMGQGDVTPKDVNAYKAIKEYNASNNDVDNSNIVIMYLPPEDDK
jgi:hypothetical protein